jgi:xylulokinase
MPDALFGLDIGTSSTKAVLFDIDGNELVRAESDPYPFETPSPGWVEQDPERIWEAVEGVVRRIVGAKSPQVNIQAICMAVQSGSLLAADASGRPVTPLITWLDGRTKGLVQKWKQDQIETKVRRLSGWSLYPGLPLPTIAWLKDHEPEVFKAAAYFFSLNDFLTYRLTGERITNPSNAGGMQLVDIHHPQWQAELCQLAGVSTHQLSQIQPSGTLIGPIFDQLSEEWGLPKGIPLINGGHDQACTALGLGLLEPGKMLLACGTAWVYSSPALDPNPDKLPKVLDMNYHAVPEAWIVSQSLGGMGASLSWWMDQTGSGSRDERFKDLTEALTRTEPNQELFFMPLTGGYDGPATIRSGGFVGLGLNHTWGDMGRAIMESPGYELRWALDRWDQAEMIKSLWMVGGAANNPLWPEILAGITGIPIQVPAYDNWPALGAAILGGIGNGVYPDAQTGAEIFQRSSRTIQPDQSQQAVYASSFERYCQYRQAWDELQSI